MGLSGLLIPQTSTEKALAQAPTDWELWLRVMFAYAQDKPMASYHCRFWEWLWAIEAGKKARPRANVWPRGFAKSSNGQRGVVAVGARATRRYVLYVMATQPQADNSVSNVAAMIEKGSIDKFYPQFAEREVSKYGSSRGWRRNRIRTASGFTIDAMGLESAKRGANVEGERPDFIIFDDIDNKHDTAETTQRKLEIISKDILPMGTEDAVVLILQNLILPNGAVSQITGSGDDPVDFLTDIEVDGPYKAVEGLEVELYRADNGKDMYRITQGTPTWPGMGLAACEHLINTEGLSAFEAERQNEVTVNKNALLSAEVINRNRVGAVPEGLEKIVVAFDPPAETGGAGIVVKGLKVLRELGAGGQVIAQKHTYRLKNASTEAVLPHEWAEILLLEYLDWKANAIVFETNQGGKMGPGVLRETKIFGWQGGRVAGFRLTWEQQREASLLLDGRTVPILEVRASDGKRTRAEPVANRDQQGLGHFVGVMKGLEKLWTSWQPGEKSPDPLDADVWAEFALVPELGAAVKRKPYGGGL